MYCFEIVVKAAAAGTTLVLTWTWEDGRGNLTFAAAFLQAAIFAFGGATV